MGEAQAKVLRTIFLLQGAYFIITGIWPVLGMESFLLATGPKQDTWLVEMVGLLSASIGLTYIVAALRNGRLPFVLGYAAAVSFLFMDVVYVAKDVIARVYLIDAFVQLAFIASVSFFMFIKKSGR